MVKHDPDMCFCGRLDVPITEEETDTYLPCPCPCEKCQANRERIKRFHTMGSLMKRLLAAKIQPETLADMVWCLIEQALEDKIKKETASHVRRLLKDIKLQSTIWGNSLDFDDEANGRLPGLT